VKLNEDGIAELRPPPLQRDSTIKTFTFRRLAIAGSPLLILLVWFAYWGNLPKFFPGGVASTQPGWVGEKNASGGLSSAKPNQGSIVSPNQDGVAELRPPVVIQPGWVDDSNAFEAPSSARPNELPSHGGVAAAQPGWAEQAPLLVQEGSGGGPGRSGESLVIVVAPNQTLCQICLYYLGRYSLSLVDEIVQLNPSLKDPNFIMAGQRLRLPVKSEQRREPTPRKVEPSTAVAENKEENGKAANASENVEFSSARRRDE